MVFERRGYRVEPALDYGFNTGPDKFRLQGSEFAGASASTYRIRLAT